MAAILNLCNTKSRFFVPMHVEHLEQICPLILKYLGLAPGWRFLIDEDYEDVWEDQLGITYWNINLIHEN